jgi:hypothetical protein
VAVGAALGSWLGKPETRGWVTGAGYLRGLNTRVLVRTRQEIGLASSPSILHANFYGEGTFILLLQDLFKKLIAHLAGSQIDRLHVPYHYLL